MAIQNIALLTDDLDGTEATQTVTFGLAGRQFTIDLNDENANRLIGFLTVFVEAATEVVPQVKSAPVKSNGEAAAVRAWAIENGYQIGDRGRIPAQVTEAYHKAQTVEAPATATA